MKRIFALFLALIMILSCTVFAGDFNASVKFGTDKNGNTTVTVQDSDLFGMQDVTLTVACTLAEAYVVYEGKAVESTLANRKITFSVIGGGTYTIKAGTPSDDELPAPTTVTITYTDGVDSAVIFADQTYTVALGSATPAFSGTPSRTGYTFNGWNPAVSETATTDVTYVAQWKRNAPSSGGSSSSSDKEPTPAPDSADVTIDSGNNSGSADQQVEVSAKVELDSTTGEAQVTMDSSKLEESLAQHVKDTETPDASGSSNPVTVTIDLSEKETTIKTVTVDSASVAAIADAAADSDNAVSGLTVKVDAGEVTLDADVLSQAAAEGQPLAISITSAQPEGLTKKQQKLIGDRPVIEITVTAGDKELTDLGDGRIQASLPYTPAKNEKLDKLVVWRVLDDGSLVPIPCTYEDGMVHFELDHLSHYVIVSFPFADVSTDAWYYGDVAYAWSTGLMNGTATDVFSPNAVTSRGMIVTILWRMEGQPAPKSASTFTDVKPGSYYEQAVAWAAENGIVNGYGNGQFAPDANITREQFATILHRYAKDYKGYDVSIGEDTNILSYSDAFSISDYAFPALQWACGAGLMNGSGDSLMPGGYATRAQAAALLHRFCENVQ